MIKVITEIDSLNDFNFGGGAVACWEKIKALGLENDVETYISESYPDGLTDMELNQFVWFELDEFIEEMEKEQKEKQEEKTKQLKEQARKELTKKGFVIDGSFEGDFKTWMGVYARPSDKPTYLDPSDGKEAEEQAKYAINGFNQDFSEWFEWEIDGLKIKEN
ncbi:hypothetical protein LW81_037 [Lactococcus phage LW81]|uniref:Uncharacterized protein n=1 Tax=Lactococcus phage LW81 TaxID=1965482 RepID=A0A1W6JN36_9CAUD|nr:hypothetical protein H1Z34_gp037 [Lactococcus phage LW81]ARM67607.1 hypothetical protein LW81_037 [Lactococcus phage LW81]